MPVYNADGLPVQLVVRADRNFSDLSAKLSPGQRLQGRITEVFDGGRAIVNFRGIPVTADLQGVSVQRGEVIAVEVQELTGTPTFRLLMEPAPVPAAREGSEDEWLAHLSLPRDAYHRTLVRLLVDYGARPTREAVTGARDAARAIGGYWRGEGASQGRVLETAAYLQANGLPPNRDLAAAAREFLFGPVRLPFLLTRLDRLAGRLASAPETPAAVGAALDRSVKAAGVLRVVPDGQGASEQLRLAVTGLGLGHEPALARGEVAAAAPGATLKASLLELAAALRATAAPGLADLRDLTGELLRVVEAQQLGSASGVDDAVVYVQFPLAAGSDLLGGEFQVAWRRDRKQPAGRDPKAPARLSLELETRALGTVRVDIRLLAENVSLAFRVVSEEVRAFIADELPELARRLTGMRLRVDGCGCELGRPRAAGEDESVPPAPSLDVKA